MKKSVASILGIFFILPAFASGVSKSDGVVFSCDNTKLSQIEKEVDQYLLSLKIDRSLYTKTLDKKNKSLNYRLNTLQTETDTLTLYRQIKYNIEDEEVRIPVSFKAQKMVKTTSRKEIVLSLMQHGRETKFTGDLCTSEAFKDHVGIRQNIVLWGQKLNFGWPNGGPAYWNEKYWDKGTPLKNVSIVDAFLDVFLNQKEYGIGCYTATKLVMIQGVVDYYARVNKNPVALQKVIDRLYSRDQDPLVNIEPRKMWSFERDFNMAEVHEPGKILVIHEDVAPGNFVPGDWAYFYNTDVVSWKETGYEGSNAIYLGKEKFGDYYNTNNHAYSYRETLDKVYQWRHGVWDRVEDASKKKPLADEDYLQLGRTPKYGGLLLDYRVHHDFFM